MHLDRDLIHIAAAQPCQLFPEPVATQNSIVANRLHNLASWLAALSTPRFTYETGSIVVRQIAQVLSNFALFTIETTREEKYLACAVVGSERAIFSAGTQERLVGIHPFAGVWWISSLRDKGVRPARELCLTPAGSDGVDSPAQSNKIWR